MVKSSRYLAINLTFLLRWVWSPIYIIFHKKEKKRLSSSLRYIHRGVVPKSTNKFDFQLFHAGESCWVISLIVRVLLCWWVERQDQCWFGTAFNWLIILPNQSRFKSGYQKHPVNGGKINQLHIIVDCWFIASHSSLSTLKIFQYMQGSLDLLFHANINKINKLVIG